jgi:opacity protein-like surface antigen
MRKLVVASLLLVAVASTLVVAAIATADQGSSNISAHGGLSGYQETPLTISTTGGGTFTAKIANDGESFEWTLSYEALEGSVLQAHIHFGAAATSGGISIFLCTNLGNGPVGTQVCPAAPATISGVARPADVIGPAGQGIEAGAFGEIVAAMRAGFAYANVHSTKWPGGEIRGQLGSGNDG